MARTTAAPLFLSAALLLIGPAATQDPKPVLQDAEPAAKPKTFGKIFKREVDGLINGFVAASRDGGLAGGSCVQVAKTLTAMGHSHRFYSAADGPVVRTAIRRLLGARQRDGSYRDSADDDGIATTGWVVDALEVMDPVEHASEVKEGRAWLVKQRSDDTPWTKLLQSMRASALRTGSPIDSGASAAGRVARGPIRTADGALDLRANVSALLELAAAQEVAREMDREAKAQATASWTPIQQRGIEFLMQQQKDGTFFANTPGGPVPDVGLSGLGLAALQTKPRTLRNQAEQQAIQKGLIGVADSQNADGSFGQHTVNYTTCAVIKALAMSKQPEFKPHLAKAQKYILTIQNIEDRGYGEGDRDYGSIGYGGDQRGDLSNLQMAVEALRESGLDEDHEAFAKAIVFLQRTQNLRAVNDFEERGRDDSSGDWYRSSSGDDGGAAYYPGNSPAGYVTMPDGTRVPRSYGSMTYALLKTYTLSGVKANDRRVRAAIDWIRRNWTLVENPGSDPKLPEKTRYQGLFYAYMVLAQALDVMGYEELEVFVETDGASLPKTIDWRAEMRAQLDSMQRADGSWLNERNDRWYKGQELLCTIYALLAYDRCSQ